MQHDLRTAGEYLILPSEPSDPPPGQVFAYAAYWGFNFPARCFVRQEKHCSNGQAKHMSAMLPHTRITPPGGIDFSCYICHRRVRASPPPPPPCLFLSLARLYMLRVLPDAGVCGGEGSFCECRGARCMPGWPVSTMFPFHIWEMRQVYVPSLLHFSIRCRLAPKVTRKESG